MRRSIKGDPEVSILREMFSYDPSTGEIRHKGRRHGAKHGEIAGRIDDDGYRIIKLFGRNFRGAKVAWAIHYGEWPTGIRDHINGMTSDDRISNLRPATHAQNMQNKRKSDKTGNPYKGITNVKYGKIRRWRAGIYKNGETAYLGYFDTPEEAHDRYVEAAKELFGEFANAG
jgi:hypothetical protein